MNYHDVLHVCDPWIRQDEIETAMMDTGVNASYADFSNGCDLGSHSGYSRAREMLFQWVVMHVPRGPAELFPEEVVDDPRRASRAKRYLKLVRHLLLLGQTAIQEGCRVVWIMHYDSKVMRLSEAKQFWKGAWAW